MTLQVYAHIVYTLVLVLGGGYLGYKYGQRTYDKVVNIIHAVTK